MFNNEEQVRQRESLAETLSRLPSRRAQDIIPLDLQAHQIAFSDRRIQAITTANRERNHPVNCVPHFTTNGWPSRYSDIPKVAQCYWDMHDEPSMEDDLLIKGERIVIPTALHDQFLVNIHEGHVSTSKASSRQRESYTSQNINAEIEDFMNWFQTCILTKSSGPAQPFINQPIPALPW